MLETFFSPLVVWLGLIAAAVKAIYDIAVTVSNLSYKREFLKIVAFSLLFIALTILVGVNLYSQFFVSSGEDYELDGFTPAKLKRAEDLLDNYEVVAGKLQKLAEDRFWDIDDNDSVKVYFDEYSHGRSNAQTDDINKLIEFVQTKIDGSDGELLMMLRAYANSLGDDHFNRKVSWVRARTIRDVLIDKFGKDRFDFLIVPLGESQTLPGEAEEDLGKWRYVDVIVLEEPIEPSEPPIIIHSLKITVRTHQRNGSGTDANTYLTIGEDCYALHGKFEERLVESTNHALKEPMILQDLKKKRVVIRHDASRLFAGWRLDLIRIEAFDESMNVYELYDSEDVVYLSRNHHPGLSLTIQEGTKGFEGKIPDDCVSNPGL